MPKTKHGGHAEDAGVVVHSKDEHALDCMLSTSPEEYTKQADPELPS